MMAALFSVRMLNISFGNLWFWMRTIHYFRPIKSTYFFAPVIVIALYLTWCALGCINSNSRNISLFHSSIESYASSLNCMHCLHMCVDFLNSLLC